MPVFRTGPGRAILASASVKRRRDGPYQGYLSLPVPTGLTKGINDLNILRVYRASGPNCLHHVIHDRQLMLKISIKVKSVAYHALEDPRRTLFIEACRGRWRYT